MHMGTWLGVTREGRFKALTNYRDPAEAQRQFSRGDIVRVFLAESDAPADFIQKLSNNKGSYGGYMSLLGMEINCSTTIMY